VLKTVEKPWGIEDFLLNTDEPTQVKILSVEKGKRNSLHFHRVKNEIVYCVSGSGILYKGTNAFKLLPGHHYFVEKTIPHRLQAFDDLKILEIGIGKYDETDITRIQDDYGRT
jgi:mannose-1-phosphate guanylyltransferase